MACVNGLGLWEVAEAEVVRSGVVAALLVKALVAANGSVPRAAG